MPVMSTTCWTYALQLNIAALPLDTNIEQIKKCFNPLVLLPPPTFSNLDEYNYFIVYSNDAETEFLLDQPLQRRSRKQNKVFVSGDQATDEDVVSFIANWLCWINFQVDFDVTVSSTQPVLVSILLELADLISSQEFRTYFDLFQSTRVYMAHTIIMSVYNIITNMVKSAKNTTIVRSLKATGHVSPNMIKMPLAMARRLVEELKLNMSSRTLGNLFARKPPTYNVFHPKVSVIDVSPEDPKKT